REVGQRLRGRGQGAAQGAEDRGAGRPQGWRQGEGRGGAGVGPEVGRRHLKNSDEAGLQTAGFCASGAHVPKSTLRSGSRIQTFSARPDRNSGAAPEREDRMKLTWPFFS